MSIDPLRRWLLVIHRACEAYAARQVQATRRGAYGVYIICCLCLSLSSRPFNLRTSCFSPRRFYLSLGCCLAVRGCMASCGDTHTEGGRHCARTRHFRGETVAAAHVPGGRGKWREERGGKGIFFWPGVAVCTAVESNLGASPSLRGSCALFCGSHFPSRSLQAGWASRRVGFEAVELLCVSHDIMCALAVSALPLFLGDASKMPRTCQI